MIHLAPHWNWKGHESDVIPVMAYTNCDTVELFLNRKSFGMKSLEFPRQGNSGAWNRYDNPVVSITTGDLHLMWDVPYETGTLKAVGRKGGKVVVEEVITTTGTPDAIRLSLDRNSINADDRDVAHLKIEIVDSKGLMVPEAQNKIQVSVEGQGNLIGLDNGNPRDHTSMKSSTRQVFNGLALAVIQAGKQAGKVNVQVSSPGLKESWIEITVRKVVPDYVKVEDWNGK
jgi:beta-galactosidase